VRQEPILLKSYCLATPKCYVTLSFLEASIATLLEAQSESIASLEF